MYRLLIWRIVSWIKWYLAMPSAWEFAPLLLRLLHQVLGYLLFWLYLLQSPFLYMNASPLHTSSSQPCTSMGISSTAYLHFLKEVQWHPPFASNFLTPPFSWLKHNYNLPSCMYSWTFSLTRFSCVHFLALVHVIWLFNLLISEVLLTTLTVWYCHDQHIQNACKVGELMVSSNFNALKWNDKAVAIWTR